MTRLAQLLTFVLLVSIRESQGYSGGAPDDRACGTMAPGHGGTPQNTESPYFVNLNQVGVKGGEKVRVTLSSANDATEFKGFLALAQKLDAGKLKSDALGAPAGKIQKPVGADAENVKHVKCGNNTEGALTHSDPSGKKTMVFDWIAPNDEGDYVILVTFVKDYSTYWVQVRSTPVKVTKNSNYKEVTTQAPKIEKKELSKEAQELLGSYYEGCGKTKGCFGLTTGCIENRDCELFTTFSKDGTRHTFQVSGKVPGFDSNRGYAAVGLSFDKIMGDDSVSACVLSRGEVRPYAYYNTNQKDNKVMSNNSAGFEGPVEGLKGRYLDGVIFCEFTRTSNLNISELNNKVFDLEKDDYYFMLARGKTGSNLFLAKHDDGDKIVSASAHPLSYIGIVGGKSNILIQLHAGIMIIAWLLCASTGMFTARYYKQTHTDFNPLNKAFWFLLHITCMFSAAFLTVCGIILILIEIRDLSKGLDGAGYYHPILGFVLLGLAVVQVLIAFFRPHPGTARRPIFNWIHWTIGNSAHIVGIACIFLAKELSKSGLKEEGSYLWVVTGFVVFHVVMHVIMSIHTIWADKQMDIQVKMRAARPGPMKPSGKSDEAPGTGFRTAMLTLYLVGCAAVAIYLIVKIVIGL